MTRSHGRDHDDDAGDREARIAARMERLQEQLRRRRIDVAPDEHFADRLVAGLRPEPVELLRWAALRLLPVSMLLVLALAAYALQASSQSAGQKTGASEQAQQTDVITWILEPGEGTR